MSTCDCSFKILYPPKDDLTVGPAPILVYGVSVYSNRDLIALLRNVGNDPDKMWMGRPPEREPVGDLWFFVFDQVAADVECNLEIWCGKCRELLGRVRCLHTAKAGIKPKTQGPTISYPHSSDNTLSSTFLAYGGTDDSRTRLRPPCQEVPT